MPACLIRDCVNLVVKMNIPARSPDVPHRVAFSDKRTKKGWPGLRCIKARANSKCNYEMVSKHHCEAIAKPTHPSEKDLFSEWNREEIETGGVTVSSVHPPSVPVVHVKE